jgi:hypothetical protein
MSQNLLNGPCSITCLQQVCGKAVMEGVGIDLSRSLSLQ